MFPRMITFLLLTWLAVGCGPQYISFEKQGGFGQDHSSQGGGSDNPIDPGPSCPGCANPELASEGFLQTPQSTAVDILMVVDNSPSMDAVQSKVSVGFNSLISALSTVDWQIGFTTTDIAQYNGNLANLVGTTSKILSRDTTNAAQIFHDTLIAFGTAGSGDERGIYAANNTITLGKTANAAFFRQNAALAIVFISDEDERSTGGQNLIHNGNGSTGPIESYDQPDTLVDNVRYVFGSEKTLSTYGIIIKSGDYDCYNTDTQGFFGTFYETLARMTGGGVGSLCDSDYTSTLSGIGQNISTLINSVTLTHEPIKGAVTVKLEPEQDDIDWVVAGNKIVFNKPPKKDTKIHVNYYWQP